MFPPLSSVNIISYIFLTFPGMGTLLSSSCVCGPYEYFILKITACILNGRGRLLLTRRLCSWSGCRHTTELREDAGCGLRTELCWISLTSWWDELGVRRPGGVVWNYALFFSCLVCRIKGSQLDFVAPCWDNSSQMIRISCVFKLWTSYNSIREIQASFQKWPAAGWEVKLTGVCVEACGIVATAGQNDRGYDYDFMFNNWQRVSVSCCVLTVTGVWKWRNAAARSVRHIPVCV